LRIFAAAVALTQSDGPLGSLKAIVQVISRETSFLIAYELTPPNGWRGPFGLFDDNGPIDKVTGSPAFIQSNYSDSGQFELLVPRGQLIYHYVHPIGTLEDSRWQPVATLEPPREHEQLHPVALSLFQNNFGKLDLVSRERSSHSPDFLVGYEFDPASGWGGPVDLVDEHGHRIIAEDHSTSHRGDHDDDGDKDHATPHR
jgi:hypothetical protein